MVKTAFVKIWGEMVGAVDYSDFINKNNPTIIQIGAHDGVLGEEYGFQELLDSLKNFNLILVEPLSPYFDNLVKYLIYYQLRM